MVRPFYKVYKELGAQKFLKEIFIFFDKLVLQVHFKVKYIACRPFTRRLSLSVQVKVFKVVNQVD